MNEITETIIEDRQKSILNNPPQRGRICPVWCGVHARWASPTRRTRLPLRGRRARPG